MLAGKLQWMLLSSFSLNAMWKVSRGSGGYLLAVLHHLRVENKAGLDSSVGLGSEEPNPGFTVNYACYWKEFTHHNSNPKCCRYIMKDVEPTIMENPIGPLITQFGMGLSFLSQHLRTLQTNGVKHIQSRPIRFTLLRPPAGALSDTWSQLNPWL